MKKRKVDIKIDNQPLALDRILKGGVYIIPKYQRNYRWTEDNWEELIQSVENGHENFFGTLFLMNIKNRKYSKYEVIDGQQRLTTINILIKSLELIIEDGMSKGLLKKSNRLEDCVEGLYLCRYETRNAKPIPRLTLQELENAQQEFKEIMSMESIPDSIKSLELKKNEIESQIKQLSIEVKLTTTNLKEKKDKRKTLPKKSNSIDSIEKEISNLQSKINSFKIEVKDLRDLKRRLIQSVKSNKTLIKAKSITQKNIYGAFEYFVKNLKSKNEKDLLQFYNNLLDKQFLIRMETEDQNSVYEYFKSLNATGVQLAISDILKNNLFQYLGKSKQNNEKVIASFETIIESLGKNSLNLDDFLLNSINSRANSLEIATSLGIKEKPINKDNLLRAFDLILSDYHKQTKEGSKKLVNELVFDANHYIKIAAPGKNNNLKLTDEVFYFYNILRHIVPSKPLSFLLASSKKYNTEKHLEITKLATYVAVRHAIMPSRDMKTLEGIFFKARKALHSGTFGSIIDSFKEATAYDLKKSEINKDHFATWNWSNSQALAINCLVYRSEIIKAPKNTNYYSELSAEHIMPQNLNKESKKYWHLPKILNINTKAKSNKEIYSEFVFQIGNYIILWGGDNSRLGNKPFTSKRNTYKNYPYKHIKGIAKKSDWTQKDIVTRSNQIYKLFELLRK
jgi:uncharacterized protein with ParB-like and HNH nuclease domain